MPVQKTKQTQLRKNKKRTKKRKNKFICQRQPLKKKQKCNDQNIPLEKIIPAPEKIQNNQFELLDPKNSKKEMKLFPPGITKKFTVALLHKKHKNNKTLI